MSSVSPPWLEIAAGVATLAGAFLFLASAIGLLRLPDFFSRVHAPTKAATLGVSLLGLASLLESLPRGDLAWIEDLVLVLFLLLTVPVGSQVLLKAAIVRGVAEAPGTRGETGVRDEPAGGPAGPGSDQGD